MAADVIAEHKIDLIAGGPPCQDFSSAGKRDLAGGRADLTYSYAEIVRAVRPQFFVMENVERIRKSNIILEVMELFEKSGYGLTAVLLDASYCGAPQARQRFFLVGALDAPHDFLLGHLFRTLSEKPLTVRDYFGERIDVEYYYRHPRNYSRRGVYSIDEPSATVRGVNRPLPPGYELHHNDPEGIELSAVRPLTAQERAEIQTFPPDFEFVGTKTAREQMIGNAVPVALGRFVGSALRRYWKVGPIPSPNEMVFVPPTRPTFPITALHRLKAKHSGIRVVSSRSRSARNTAA